MKCMALLSYREGLTFTEQHVSDGPAYCFSNNHDAAPVSCAQGLVALLHACAPVQQLPQKLSCRHAA